MNNETNKTSVDYLWNLIPPDIQNYIIKQFNGYEKAKEMEKEQIIDFAIKCMFNSDDIGSNLRNHFIQKYNETYGGNK
jgi:hypothetical protein